MENKYLAIIVAILAIVVIIVGFFAYSTYQTSEMDKYMKNGNTYFETAESLINEAETLVNDNKYDQAIDKIDEAIWNTEQGYKLDQKAYQYANGPYKDLISVAMKKGKVTTELLNSWKARLQDIQNGDLYAAAELKKQEQDRLNDLNKYDDEYESIKAQNPGMQEHIDKNWG